MTTVDSVNDMESIRKALGAKQINYYGFSYGSYLGQVYGPLVLVEFAAAGVIAWLAAR